jgi:hypothetical protein
MRIRRIALTVFMALFAALTASPNDNVVVTLFVTTVKQDSPVQIVGFKLPGDAAADEGQSESTNPPERAVVPLCRWCPKVLLRNATSKQVKNVTLQGLMGDPNRPVEITEVSGMGILSESRLGQPSPYVIAPNGDATYGDNGLWPFQMAVIAAPTVNSNCLHVAVVVWRVEFSDGTEWMSNRGQEQLLWKESLTQENTNSCKDLSAVDLKQLHTGIASFEPPSRDLSSGITQSYSAACPVRRINGELSLGHCAW